MSAQLDFYLARAAAARIEANQAVLVNVRDRALCAASAWDAMAARAQRTDTHRANTEAAKAAAAAAEPAAA
jgi:hypothetical protein